MLKVRNIFIFLFLLTTLHGCQKESNDDIASSNTTKNYKWKLVTAWPKNFPGLGVAPERFADLVNEMSDGRLQIKVYSAGEIVSAMEVFDAVSGNSPAAEMGHAAAYYWKGKIAASPLFTSVPFGMNAQEMNGWLHHGGGMDLWHEIYEPFNLIPMAAGNTGIQMGGWFNKEISTINDFKGLKMRIPGLGGEVFSRAGGTAVNMPGGEIFTSLQTGVIDAAEWVSPYNDLAFGFQNIAKYYYYPGWQEPGPTIELIINKTAYNNLPNDLQTIIEVAARSINQDMLDEYTSMNQKALKQLQDNGVEIRPYPKSVLEELRRISDMILKENVEKDPTFKKVYESYVSYKESAEEYHKISEQAYYEIRK